MWKTIVPAAAVLAAEAIIRRRINALPAETFPLRVGPRVQLRRAHNRGLLCSKLAQKPRAAAALQTVSAAALAAMAAVCVCRRSGTALQIGMGLMLGGALANLIERWARGSVTDYVYLPRAVIPFFRRIIWNAADLSVLTGCITAVIALMCDELLLCQLNYVNYLDEVTKPDPWREDGTVLCAVADAVFVCHYISELM